MTAVGDPRSAAGSGPGPDAELVLDEISSLVEELHRGGTGPLRLDQDLVGEFGFDSLALVELQDRLEHACGVQLPERVLATARTPRDWLEAVLEVRGRGAAPRAAPPVSRPLEPRRPGSPMPEGAGTLVEALAWHVASHPDLVGVRLLGTGDGHGTEDLTYGALDAEAKTWARGLVADGLGPGERVAIMLPTCREYFVVSMAVLLAGGVPVPIYPPARLSVLEEHLRRQSLLLANAGASVLVTVPEALLAARLLRAHVPTLRAVRTPAMLSAATGGSTPLPVPATDDIALIQYTSGSTGDPKGVILTHAQLLANIRAMGSAAQVDSSDVFVSWLPLYHDMGLIGAWHAASLYFGMLLVVMSPLEFLARPASWLEAMTQYAGTLSAAPNFGYESCVERIGEDALDALDLSAWRLAFNGSEPVSALTVERFTRRFSCCGFRPGTMSPAYGLAEVGVGVAFNPLGRAPRIDTVARGALQNSGRAVPATARDTATLSLVSCGPALPGYEIRVADPSGLALPERHEGRVECRGPSTTAGYFANEPATRALWDGEWLDTGDSGYLADGELYLTGRVKDIVIRAGRNLHPEELEQALGELDHLHGEEVAVFGISDPTRGTERLVVAAETALEASDERDALRTAIHRRAVELLGVGPDDVVLVAPGALPRTASGKIRRSATRDAFTAGVLGRRPPPVAVQLARFAWSGAAPTLRRVRHGTGGLLYAVWAWTAVALVAVPLWLAMMLPSTPRARWRLTRAAGRVLRGAVGVTLDVDGALPPGPTPVVIVSNHTSFVDGLVLLLALRDPVVFVSSTDFEHQPVVGRFLRRLGCVFVHRDQPERTAQDVSQLAQLVRAGQRLVLFPEGAISRAPGLRRFHLGAFATAVAAGCPVVPVGIRGTRAVVPAGSFLPHRARVEVVIGSALMATGDDFRAESELAERARHAVGELSGEPALA